MPHPNTYPTLILLACLLSIGSNAYGQTRAPSGDWPIEFRTEVMPIFSRYGCNAAECHGSATGQGDFKLSLFGGDWEQDYRAVVRQLEGRRIHRRSPQRSLLLTKPTQQLEHGGGERFAVDSVAAKRIGEWIARGASDLSTVQIHSIRLSVEQSIVQDDRPISIRVVAESNVGSRDVTEDATYLVSNPSAVKLISPGEFQVLRPGRYFVVAGFLGLSQRMELVRPWPDSQRLDETGRTLNNSVDRRIATSSRLLNLPVPTQASDQVVLRRLFLGLTGRLPTVEQSRQFLADAETLPREQLVSQWVDRLLESDAFESYWTYWLRGELAFRMPGNDASAADELNGFLNDVIQNDRSLAELVEMLITSTGNAKQQPAAVYHRQFSDGRAEAEAVAASILSIRIGCANCHAHPLDRWTQEDYHGLAAIFATLKRDPKVVDFPQGRVIQPKTGEPAVPRIPGERDLELDSVGNRNKLANWVISSEQFRVSLANRVWKQLMGRGLVEPVDDLRLANPPVDPGLLQALGKHFASQGFRLRPLIREIVMSQAYATEAIPFEQQAFLAGYVPQPLSPEVFHDSSRDVLLGRTETNRAVEQWNSVSMDPGLALLRGCEGSNCAASNENPASGLREKLQLINGQFVNRWVADPNSWLHQQIQAGESSGQILGQFYWRALNRAPRRAEVEFWAEQIKRDVDPDEQRRLLEDALWSLINSREFTVVQ